MIKEYFDHLKPIESDPIWIGKYAKELNKEISTNMWAISIPPDVAKVVTVAEFMAFFERVIANRHEQIRKMNRHSMIFYAWYDRLAGQLRFNCISEIHKKLPFGNDFEEIDSLEAIIEDFLDFERNHVLSDEADESDESEVEEMPEHSNELEDADELDDAEIVNDQEDFDDEEDEEQVSFLLKVYVQRLNL